MKPVSLRKHSGRDKISILRRLDIDPDAVKMAPKVTPILSRCFGVSEDRFPKEQVLNYLKASPSPAARSFVESWNGISKRDSDSISLEAVCVKADVSPLEILGAVLMAAKNLKAEESALKAILAHPDVVDATVESAKLPGPMGNADRRILHEAVGFLPTKKGGGVEINFMGRPKDNDDATDDADDAFDACFTNNGISSRLEDWENRRRALTDGK